MRARGRGHGMSGRKGRSPELRRSTWELCWADSSASLATSRLPLAFGQDAKEVPATRTIRREPSYAAPMPPGLIRLSKSRVMAGLQCHKRLWWTVHEPTAPELQPDEALQVLFDDGNHVDEWSCPGFVDGARLAHQATGPAPRN